MQQSRKYTTKTTRGRKHRINRNYYVPAFLTSAKSVRLRCTSESRWIKSSSGRARQLEEQTTAKAESVASTAAWHWSQIQEASRWRARVARTPENCTDKDPNGRFVALSCEIETPVSFVMFSCTKQIQRLQLCTS